MRELWDYDLLTSLQELHNSVSNAKEYRMHPSTAMRLRIELPNNGKGVLPDNWHGGELTMFGLPVIQDWSVPDDEIYLLPQEVGQ
jgi:hypothetical protein